MELIRAYRKSTAFERNQLRYIFLAFIVSAVGGLIHFSSSFGYKEPFPHDFLLIAFTSVTSYAIVKHRLMDIRIIVKTGVIYALSTGVITGSFMLLVLGVQRIFSEYRDHASIPVAAVAALVIALAFYPVKNRIQRVVDRYFYKEGYDYHRVLGDASKAMTSILDFEKLLSYILRAVNDSMKIERGWILLRSEAGRKFDVRMTAAFGEEHEFPAEAPLTSRNALVEYVRAHSEAIVREEIEQMLPPDESSPISQEMARFNADVAVPIVLKNRLMGTILLGPKLSGDIYTDEDLQLLTTLANQAAVAIRNAQLYSRLQQDLDTIRYLEREKAKAERLASLGTMAAGIAHEIKNPLVSIKTFAQLLPEKASDPEFRDDFSQIAINEIERIDSLVQGLLSLAKPSPPVFEPLDVHSILDEIVTSVLIRMENKKISLKKDYGDEVPPAMGDVNQLKQVFSNIIINAIQATPEGGRITVTTCGVRPSDDEEGNVTVKISDNGKGISQEESERIFNPFFTTKHEGVGLGLTICHRIVEDHRGTIQMDSEVGKGTAFTITVPAAKREGSVASRTESSR
jgi:two-component system nitrogen regulation sensor histidine kinase GlnL